MRGRAALVGGAFGLVVASGLSRTFTDALLAADDHAQWCRVLRHEQAFVRALTAGSAAEGNDGE